MSLRKIRYEIDLTAARPDPRPVDAELRALRPEDLDALAHLILDAYRGTIDDEGETMAEAVTEIEGWLAGTPIMDRSIGAVVDGALVAAVLVMTLDDAPFIAVVMTAAASKGSGLGRAVVEEAVTGLRRDGHRRVVLYITDGNVPSERLFASVGARSQG